MGLKGIEEFIKCGSDTDCLRKLLEELKNNGNKHSSLVDEISEVIPQVIPQESKSTADNNDLIEKVELLIKEREHLVENKESYKKSFIELNRQIEAARSKISALKYGIIDEVETFFDKKDYLSYDNWKVKNDIAGFHDIKEVYEGFAKTYFDILKFYNWYSDEKKKKNNSILYTILPLLKKIDDSTKIVVISTIDKFEELAEKFKEETRKGFELINKVGPKEK